MTEAANTEKQLQIGDEIRENGIVTAIYAGLTKDGKQQIFAMPKDLTTARGYHIMTFNKAAKVIEKMNGYNAFGHHDWQIPNLESLYVLKNNRNEGSLKGTFEENFKPNSGGSEGLDWYWSSSEDNSDGSSEATAVCFWAAFDDGFSKDEDRLSCRAVRLVPVAAPSLG